MAFMIDERLLLGAPDTDCQAIETMHELRCLGADILGRREQPIVGLAPSADGDAPVLACGEVRAALGPGVRICVICDDTLLDGLRELLGARLALGRGAARIWWPGAGARCDPADHPTVLALEDEPRRATLEELARQFELSRPCVRAQIRLIEDARAFLENELTRAREQNRRVHERLRDAQIECHTLGMRAEAAEASLAAAPRPPDLNRR